MASYENKVEETQKKGEDLPDKINISMVKYFWQANPLTGSKADNIPKFLRQIDVLKNFSDHELRILSKSMHHRSFTDKEVVFKQNDLGIGFYFIYSGYVDVVVEKNFSKESPAEKKSNYILTLEKNDYFGELALLQENSMRNATVIAREHCELIGLFKPDIEELINTNPIVATKLLQSVSLIISNRLFLLTKEVQSLKYRLMKLEENND